MAKAPKVQGPDVKTTSPYAQGCDLSCTIALLLVHDRPQTWAYGLQMWRHFDFIECVFDWPPIWQDCLPLMRTCGLQIQTQCGVNCKYKQNVEIKKFTPAKYKPNVA